MKYKLVLSDIDGTLLNDEYDLMSATEIAVRRLVKSGVLFATASARDKPYTLSAIKNIKELCCANAYLTGSYIETSSGDVLIDMAISKEEATFLIDQFNRVKASYCCIAKDYTIAKVNHPGYEWNFKTFSGKYSDIASFNVSRSKFYYMLAFAENLAPVVDAVNQLPDLKISAMLESRSDGMQGLSLMNHDAGKKEALMRIMDYYNIDLAQTMAIGDSIINDGPMIEAAGCGVAMENAHEKIKEKADRITEKSNNEDGVGHFLRVTFGL